MFANRCRNGKWAEAILKALGVFVHHRDETSQPGTLTQLLSTGLREPAHLWNQRTLQLERTFKAHLVKPSCKKQGHLPLDQGVSGPYPT